MALAALLLTGCYHEFHEITADRSSVAVALQWEQPEDAGTLIHNITFSADGVTQSFDTPQEASADRLQLPDGEYDILVTANMTEDDSFILIGLPDTRAGLPDVRVSLKDPVSNPAQAWYGISHASVQKGKTTVVEAKLQRLMCTLTVNIANVPAGTTITHTLANVAKEVRLTAQDDAGRYGVPGTETVGKLTLDTYPINLFPTVSGKERSLLTLDIITAAGMELSVLCDAPRMEVGKSYILELDYTKLRPYMYITPYSISEWEEGWTVSGEILNSQE
jgi:hypothetical protein